jgi:AcrR family transcriptional regulator
MKTERENYHHGDLRQALIDAALELVVEKDVSSVSLREVARKAGVSHAAPYRHFEDKEALLAAVAQEGLEMFNYSLQEANQHITNPLEKLEVGCTAYVRYAIAYPSYYRIMFGAGGANVEKKYPFLADSIQQSWMQFVNIIAQGQSMGLIRSGNPEQLAQGVWALTHGLAMLVLDGQITLNDSREIEFRSRFTIRLLVEGLMKR